MQKIFRFESNIFCELCFNFYFQLYAVDCRLTWDKLKDSMDLFILSHFLGWAGKSLLIRHAGLCWAASITWEITEVIYREDVMDSHLLKLKPLVKGP